MAAITLTPIATGFEFKEVAGNNGAIANSLTFKIATGGTFAGDNGDSLLQGVTESLPGGTTITNLPAGLIPVLVKTSATTAKLSFKGAADVHVADIANLTVTFADAQFVGGTAPAAAINDLKINFTPLADTKALTLLPPAGADTEEAYNKAALEATTSKITGTAPDGVAKVYIYNNGGTKPIGEAAVTNNAWSFDLKGISGTTAKYKDGAYNLTASASNDGKGAMTAGFAFTVDTKAPSAPSVTAVKGAISDVTPVLTGKAEKGATVKVYKTDEQAAGDLLGTTTADAKGVWTLAVTDATKLATDGNYKISALAIDAAGNETKSKALTKDNLTIDM